MSTADLLGEIKQLRADLAAAKTVIDSMVESEVEPLKALLYLVLCNVSRDAIPTDLAKRIRDAIGEGEQSLTGSERLTAAGYRRRPGRKAIGEDE